LGDSTELHSHNPLKYVKQTVFIYIKEN
jgi:hypothetical protein